MIVEAWRERRVQGGSGLVSASPSADYPAAECWDPEIDSGVSQPLGKRI
jgi:hypothetical protein